jgi:hypothetical protein
MCYGNDLNTHRNGLGSTLHGSIRRRKAPDSCSQISSTGLRLVHIIQSAGIGRHSLCREVVQGASLDEEMSRECQD